MSRNVNGVIFDLDGTLLDTRKVIAQSLKEVISSLGVNVCLDEMLRKAHSSPYRVINEYVSISRDDFRNEYWPRYQTNIGYSSAFQGVKELLEELRTRGYNIGVATSLPRSYAERGLEIIGLRVDSLVAYHDTARHKPHPEPVIEAARRLSLRPQATLYIGDRPEDIKAGKGAGAYTGAAMWDANREERAKILAACPNYVFKSMRDILYACGEKGVLLPCIFALYSRIRKNCSLLEKIYSPNIYSMREMDGTQLISNFLSLSELERIELMDKCTECFKRVISEIPEIHCTICQNKMEEEEYRKYKGRCYLCNRRRRERTQYFNKVFLIGQERGNLAYAIKAFKSVDDRPSNIGLAIPLGILVADWLVDHREELERPRRRTIRRWWKRLFGHREGLGLGRHGVDMIIPVPSSAERREEVGFDHISEILVVVQSLVDFIGINFAVLSKCKEVKLKDLSMKERERIISGAFTVEDEGAKAAIRGKSILILDDVFTTGATTNECARVLKENGARQVYVLAISRAYRST